jgi:hypothetical protein
MSRTSWIVACTLAIASPAPAAAQSAIVLFLYGSNYTPLSSLSAEGDEIGPRFGYGGGIAFQLTQSFALRASSTVINTQYRGDALAVTDSTVGRLYAFGDMQIGWPGTSNLVPYFLLGVGAVRTDFKDQNVETATYFGVRAGGGVNYLSSIGAFFLETHITGYRWTAAPFSSTQVDWAINLGLAFAFKVGG